METAANGPSVAGLTEDLKAILSTIQKIDPDRIKPQSNWARFGMASVGFTEFTEVLNDRYGLELMPTVFFEHPTLASLATYLSHQIVGAPEARRLRFR